MRNDVRRVDLLDDVRGKTWMDLGYEQWHADRHDRQPVEEVPAECPALDLGVQRAADGSVLPCLPQNDVNLTSPPLPVTCSGTIAPAIVRDLAESEEVTAMRLLDLAAAGDVDCREAALSITPGS